MPSPNAVINRYNLDINIYNVENLGNGLVGVCLKHPHEPGLDHHITIFDYQVPGGDSEWYGLDRQTQSTHRLSESYLKELLGAVLQEPKTNKGPGKREVFRKLPDWEYDHVWIIPERM